jgi:hypothetical protein
MPVVEGAALIEELLGAEAFGGAIEYRFEDEALMSGGGTNTPGGGV